MRVGRNCLRECLCILDSDSRWQEETVVAQAVQEAATVLPRHLAGVVVVEHRAAMEHMAKEVGKAELVGTAVGTAVVVVEEVMEVVEMGLG